MHRHIHTHIALQVKCNTSDCVAYTSWYITISCSTLHCTTRHGHCTGAWWSKPLGVFPQRGHPIRDSLKRWLQKLLWEIGCFHISFMFSVALRCFWDRHEMQCKQRGLPIVAKTVQRKGVCNAMAAARRCSTLSLYMHAYIAYIVCNSVSCKAVTTELWTVVVAWCNSQNSNWCVAWSQGRFQWTKGACFDGMTKHRLNKYSRMAAARKWTPTYFNFR